MATVTLNHTVKQGDSFEWLILILDVNSSPLDMTSYTGTTAGARGMIRKKYSDALPTETFTISRLNKTGILSAISNSLCHLTTAEIAALQTDASGKCYLLVTLAATETAGMLKGTYYYDIEIEDTKGFVFTPYTGTFTITQEATK